MDTEVVDGEGSSDNLRKVFIPSRLSSFWGDLWMSTRDGTGHHRAHGVDWRDYFVMSFIPFQYLDIH